MLSTSWEQAAWAVPVAQTWLHPPTSLPIRQCQREVQTPWTCKVFHLSAQSRDVGDTQ